MSWITRQRSDSFVAKTLLKKQRILEAILDSEDELEPVKAEALRELTVVLHLQETYFGEIVDTAKASAEAVLKSIIRLNASLCKSEKPILRAFARHVLLYLLMPSIRSTTSERLTRFCYQPGVFKTWDIQVSH